MKPEFNTEVIVTCAVTGGGDTVGKHPAIPVTPKEIAAAAIEAAKAGATIAHCHVREPETGQNSMRKELFAEVADRVRDSDTDVILNLTGGNGGLYIPQDDNPGQAAEGSDICTIEQRVEHAVEIKPEICSFDVGTILEAKGVYIGTEHFMRGIGKALKEAGVKPEIEVFDTSGINIANQLVEEGVIGDPPMFQLCLGIGNNGAARHPGDAGDAQHAARQRGLGSVRDLAHADADGRQVGAARRSRAGGTRGQPVSEARGCSRAMASWWTKRSASSTVSAHAPSPRPRDARSSA